MTTTTTSKPPPSTSIPSQPLTFPAQVFAKLAPSAYLAAHLNNSPNSSRTPTRPSGRKPTDLRHPTCHTGSLTHAHGSAVIRAGDTAVVCGIRGEILKIEDVPAGTGYRKDEQQIASDSRTRTREDGEQGKQEGEDERRRDMEEMASLGLLVPNIELATGCSPDNLPGGPPSTEAQVLSHRVLTLLYQSWVCGMEGLRVWSRSPLEKDDGAEGTSSKMRKREEEGEGEGDELEGETAALANPQIKAFWTLYIDILFISLDGNAFDTAWLAILAALRDTKLPTAYYDSEREMVLCDPSTSTTNLLLKNDLENIPCPLSFAVFEGEEEGQGRDRDGKDGEGKRKVVLYDPDGFEEGLCEEKGTVIVRGEGRVVGIERCGGVGVGIEGLRELVVKAGERRGEWLGVLRGLEGG